MLLFSRQQRLPSFEGSLTRFVVLVLAMRHDSPHPVRSRFPAPLSSDLGSKSGWRPVSANFFLGCVSN